MAERFDIVVAGAGHNSLIAAAYLAKAGYRCLVLEGRPIVGGGVKSAQLTLRGFTHDVCSSAHNGIYGNPILRDDELKLGEYGLEYIYPDPVYHMPFPDGSYLTQWRDLDRTCEEFAKFSKKDGLAYRRMITEYETVKPLLNAVAFTPIGFGKPINDRLAEHPHGKLWQRRLAMSAWENGKCAGVECEDGSSYRAEKAILSTIHIKHLIDMAPRELWGEDFIDGVDTWKAGLTLFETNYATTEPPKYAVAGGTLSPVHSGVMVSADRVLRMSYDYARGAVNVENPSIHAICCSIADPTRAPAGMHTIKSVAYHPYELKEGPQHWDEIKEQVSDANLKFLRRFATNLTDDKILARIVKSPLDLERMNPHNWHGSCHAGGSGPAQSGAMRPVPGWAQHRMPIPGLYQTGATTHPGGSVTGGPGRNAATVMLKDFGTSIEEVVKKA